jgi:hypothetical protein
MTFERPRGTGTRFPAVFWLTDSLKRPPEQSFQHDAGLLVLASGTNPRAAGVSLVATNGVGLASARALDGEVDILVDKRRRPHPAPQRPRVRSQISPWVRKRTSVRRCGSTICICVSQSGRSWARTHARNWPGWVASTISHVSAKQLMSLAHKAVQVAGDLLADDIDKGAAPTLYCISHRLRRAAMWGSTASWACAVARY